MTFFATLSAVMLGNGLTLAWAYWLWAGTREEKGGKPVPIKVVVFCGIFPPLLAAAGVYFAVTVPA